MTFIDLQRPEAKSAIEALACLANGGNAALDAKNDPAIDAVDALADRLSIDPDSVQRDIAKLVLGLVEFVRELLELQAIRRMEAGSLSCDQEERVGLALYRARERVRELAQAFGLGEGDLSLDLGPLGRLT